MIDDATLRAVLDPVPVAFDVRADLRLAAVLVPWIAKDGADHLLLTRRRDDLPQHPGQISFPGGAREGDEDPVTCALRESEEEIGLDARRVVVLGSLPPRVSIGGYWVHVIVGRVPSDVVLHPDPREVASVRAWPLAVLRDPARWLERAPAIDPAPQAMPHLDWEGETLWGLTARFVLDLCGRCYPRASRT